MLTRKQLNETLKGLDYSSKANSQVDYASQIKSQSSSSSAKPKSGNTDSNAQKLAHVIAGVGRAIGRTSRAIARPTTDVLTSQGGKYVHDIAQLGSDVTGDSANYLASGAIADPTKQLIAQLSHNHAAELRAEIEANRHLGLGDKGVDFKAGAKKLAGEGALAITSAVGGPEAGGIKALAEQGFKAVAKKSAKVATAGTVGGAGYTVGTNPDASVKDIVKGAAISGTLAGLAPVAGKGISKIFKSKESDFVPDRVVQIKNLKTGKVSYQRIPKNQADDIIKHVDNNDIYSKTPGRNIDENGNLYHITARTPKSMESRGFKNAGVYTLPTTENKSIISKLPEVALGNEKQAILNRNFVAGKYREFSDKLATASEGMSQKDLKLIDSIESKNELTSGEAATRVERIAKTADNPEKFKKAISVIRDFNDTRYAGDISLGRDVKYRQNYLNRTYAAEEGTAEGKAIEKLRVKAGGQPGYVKGRIIATQEEANALAALKNADGSPKYPHLQRANANAVEDTQQAIERAAHEHGSQALVKGLKEAHPGQVSMGKIGYDAGTGLHYKGLNIPGGSGVALPSDLADKYNKRAPYMYSNDKTGKALKAFDRGNAITKEARLAGGTFHSFTEAGTSAGQQLLKLANPKNLLHPIEAGKNLFDNFKVITGSLSNKAHDKHVTQLASDAADNADGLSSLDRQHLAGVTDRPQDIASDASIMQKVKHSKFNLLGQIHDMTFNRQIPEIKSMIFQQETHGLDSRIPADLEKMRSVARAVNKLGGINRAVDGLTSRQARIISRGLLATDFTEGRWRTIGSALNLSKNAPENKLARQMIVGKTIVYAVPGLIALAAAGELADPVKETKKFGDQLVDQILDPNIKSNFTTPGGTPRSLKLPRTFISEIGRIVQPIFDKAEPDKWAGVKDYASARLAALPSTSEQLVTNKDYFGNPIYGNDAQGNPISKSKVAANIGNQVLPIPGVEAIKAGTTVKNKNGTTKKQETPQEAFLNTLGFKVTVDTNSPQAHVNARQGQWFNIYDKTVTRKRAASKEVTNLVQQGKPAEARRKAMEFNTTLHKSFEPYYGSNPSNPTDDGMWDDMLQSLPIRVSEKSFALRAKS